LSVNARRNASIDSVECPIVNIMLPPRNMSCWMQ
jgi:hypothetical protein